MQLQVPVVEQETLVVPVHSILYDGERNFIFVIGDDDTVRRREVFHRTETAMASWKSLAAYRQESGLLTKALPKSGKAAALQPFPNLPANRLSV